MKKSTKTAIVLVTLAGIGAATLSAQADSRWSREGQGPGQFLQQAHGGGQGKQHGGSHHGGHHKFRMMESFDTNGDGKLSQEEIDQARSERFGGFDMDGDQNLTLAEFEKLWLDAMRERMVDRFQHLDADGNGEITAEEFKAPYAKMVRRMDRTGDGVIDLNDFPRRHHGGKGRGDKG